MTKTNIPFVDLGAQYKRFRTEILETFDRVSSTGHYVFGPEVSQFEQAFARYCEVPYALGVANGSDALYLAMRALNIGEGDEVITAPNSFIASAWTIAHTGAKVRFADVGWDMNLDPSKIQDAITPQTKAIMPVHFTGRIADMDLITDIAKANNLYVIEDAAQAVGARYKGKVSGSFGDAAGFSLHPLKNLHVHGDGGVMVTPHESVRVLVEKWRNHGLANRDECEFWGINSRLDAIQAAIVNIKLRHLDTINNDFVKLAKNYISELSDVVVTPNVKEHEQPIYHRFMIRHQERDALQAYLASVGVETKVNYPIPIHLQPAAQNLGYKKGDFPVAELLADSILSLPIYAEMPETDQQYVIEHIRQFAKRNHCKLHVY